MSLRQFTAGLTLAAGLFSLSVEGDFTTPYQNNTSTCDPDAPPTCFSYGMDYQNGGSYFQIQNSQEAFTFVSQFEGCQQAFAYNILVDPQGDEYPCTNTNLQPDDSDQMATCPINKSQMYSGTWSLIVFSNNGNDCPIAYQRNFEVAVGTQETTTFTPTVTNPVTYTPLVSITTTDTDTAFTTLPQVTVTRPSVTIQPTVSITPKAVKVVKTFWIATQRLTSYAIAVSQTTKTKTAKCQTPTKPADPDPTATITPTLITPAAAEPTITAGAKFRRALDRRVPVNQAQRIAERKARIAARNAAMHKRAPDVQVLTMTETNTALYTTTTMTVATAPSVMITNSVEITVTSTVTPSPITVMSGTTVLPPVTTTLPTPTTTKTKVLVSTSWTTRTATTTVTLLSTTTPEAVRTACRQAGGTLS